MTIASTTVATSGSTGNGVTTSFSFAFNLDPNGYGATSAASQVRVIKQNISTGAETVLTNVTDYSVSVNSDQSSSPGGSVTLTSAPSSSYKIWIELNPDFTQQTDYQNQGGFLMETVEDQDDQLTRQILVLKDMLRRAPVLKRSAGASFDGSIDGPFTAGYGVVVNNAGTGFVLGALSSVAVSSAMTAVVQAATLSAGRTAFGVPGLADNNTYTGTNTYDGRVTIDPAYAEYTSLAGTSVMLYFGAGSQSIASSKALYLIYAGNTWTVAASGIASVINFNVTSASGSDSTSNTYGVIGTVTNAGPGTTKGLYGAVIGSGSSTGSMAALVGGVTPGASTANAYGLQLGIVTTARKVDQGIRINSNSGTAALDYGFFINNDVNIAQAGFRMYAVGSGNFLSLLNSSGSTALFTVTPTGQVDSAAAIRSSGATAGIGYTTGAGGTITQGTNRTTGVTLNTICGAITLVSAAGSTTPATFTVTNSAVAATDVVRVVQKSGTDKYIILVTAVAAGSFDITFYTTGGTTTEQPVFNFAVLKAVTS